MQPAFCATWTDTRLVDDNYQHRQHQGVARETPVLDDHCAIYSQLNRAEINLNRRHAVRFFGSYLVKPILINLAPTRNPLNRLASWALPPHYTPLIVKTKCRSFLLSTIRLCLTRLMFWELRLSLPAHLPFHCVSTGMQISPLPTRTTPRQADRYRRPESEEVQ